MVDSRTEIFFLFSIFVYFSILLLLLVLLVCIFICHSVTAEQKYLWQYFLYFRICFFFNSTTSSRACGLHFHLSLCDSGAEIEFARLQRKEKTFKENTGLLLLRNMFFCFIFLHRETILIHSIQISRSKFLTFRFHLICFLMLSTFKQAVTSQDAMIPRELMPIRRKKCTHKGFVICIFWKTFKLRKNILIRNIQFAQEYSN